MTLVILAAGMGSRYGGLKQIDPIGPNGEFILDYSIYDALKAGFDHVVFIIKEENLDIFRETIGKRVENHVKVDYVFQDINDLPAGIKVPEGRVKPWGTGHAVLCAESAVSDDFAVINADDFYGRDSFVKLADFMKSADKSSEKHQFCMSGFVLENTLTENGHVSRGVCETDENGYLTRVTERTKIQRNGNKSQYFDNDEWNDLPEGSTVSMNCWAFTPALFAELKRLFLRFFDVNKDELKGEFFLPFAVQELIDDGICDVKVLQTNAKWYGVTYQEDRQMVVDAIRSMVANGEYPEKLW